MEKFLSEIPAIVKRRKKRLGRGGGSGKGGKSSKGTTRHQGARETIPLAFEGGQGKMIKRFPLLRGKGKNRSHALKPFAVDIKFLNTFNDGESVNLAELVKKNIVPDNRLIKSVKIIGNTKLSKKLTVILPVSESAKKSIEKAGGEVKI